jgi:hypothetical protein
MACYSGLTRVIRHPRDPCRSERSPSKVHPSRVSRCTCSRTCTYAYAGCTPPHSSAGCTPPHSSLTAHSPHAGQLGWQQQAGPRPQPGARDFCRVPMRHARGERRGAPLTTSYPLRGGRPFPAEPHCPSGSCAIFPARLLPASHVFIGQTFWCAARCDQWSDTFCERRE